MANKTKVLLVEDDRTMAGLIKKFLDVNGYDTIHRDNGNTAFDTFKEQKFDVCLIDVVIPQKDGYQLAKEIRALDSKVALLFISSNTSSKERDKAFKAGADDYITKPVNVDEIYLKIEKVLKR